MFKSEPICILKAGPTVDGRDIPQKVIDDIAETYDPTKYTARINEDHSEWSWKGGSVLSVEKRDDELWAEIKPNSFLLRNIENGQLLHTSCEYLEDFAKSGKAYLTGLAFTDAPASLGTTQVHLSAQRSEAKALHVCTGQVLNHAEVLSKQSEFSKEERTLINKFASWFTGKTQPEQLSQPQENDEMSKETEELLKQSIEQNNKTNELLGQVVEQLSANSKQSDGEEETPPEDEESKQVTKLEGQVEALSTKFDSFVNKFSALTDEDQRNLAGQDGGEEPYL